MLINFRVYIEMELLFWNHKKVLQFHYQTDMVMILMYTAFQCVAWTQNGQLTPAYQICTCKKAHRDCRWAGSWLACWLEINQPAVRRQQRIHRKGLTASTNNNGDGGRRQMSPSRKSIHPSSISFQRVGDSASPFVSCSIRSRASASYLWRSAFLHTQLGWHYAHMQTTR